jgi:hypothetical protein
MPASRDPLRGSPPEVATDRAAVNFDNPPEIVQEACSTDVSSEAPRTERGPYTPHWKLLARLSELARRKGLSPRAILMLQVLLWAANKRGHGQGCKPHEAMCMRGLGDFAVAMGIKPGARPGSNTGSVKRAKKEIAAYLRCVRVDVCERCPAIPPTLDQGDTFTGRTATRPVVVYYLDIDRLWRELGGRMEAAPVAVRESVVRPSQKAHGINVADGINHDPMMGSELENRSRETIEETAGTPVASVVNQISSLKTTTTGTGKTGGPRPPSPGGCGLDLTAENESEDVRFVASEAYAHWHARMGYRYSAVVHGTTRAALMRAAAAGVTLDELTDVVDGASDRELGGDAFDYCVKWKIYGAGLFWSDKGRPSGCIQQFLDRVPANRERRRRERERRDRTRAPESPGWEEARTTFPLTPELCSKREGIRLVTIAKMHAEGRCEYCRLGYAAEPGQPADGEVTAVSLPVDGSRSAGR